MVFFTADTHFGHANVIWMCERPYTSTDEMNEAMISTWNERVTGNDTIYIVGDMFFRCEDPESILKQLRGKKRLILGNHDGSWTSKVPLNRYFLSVDTMLETSDGKQAITLCHYPLLSWKHAKRSYMIHGHIHRKTDMDYWPLLCNRDRVLNAGVDINGLMPVTIEELQENNRRWKSQRSTDPSESAFSEKALQS